MPDASVYAGTTSLINGTLTARHATTHAVIPLKGSVVTALTYTIRDAAGSIVNGRSATALTPVATYLDESGNLWIPLVAADNAIVNAALVQEEHRIIVKATYNAGADAGIFEGFYKVVNPDRVP